MKELLPSDYTAHPWDSVLQKTEAEIVARNIMVILKRTGNVWRDIQWDEYKSERLKDGRFSHHSELGYFNAVKPYCMDAQTASTFCKGWPQQDSVHP